MFGFVRKWLAYHAKEYTDPTVISHLKEVAEVWEKHSGELEDSWRLTTLDECASLMVAFLDELRREWPREFLQLHPEGLPDAVSESLRASIKQAYLAGFMRGKGWLSKEQETDFGIYLGDKLAREVRSVLKWAKSKGIAFAMGFTAVSVKGYLKALQKPASTSTLTSTPPTPPRIPSTVPPSSPTEELLEKVRFLAKVKNGLPFDQRGNLNTYGVYVQSGRNREPTLPKEGILYMIGGKWLPKLIFLDEDSGKTTVVKYEKGDWEKSLDLSYEKAKKVWHTIQTNDRTSLMQALSIEEPNRPRYVDFDKQTKGAG